MEQRKANRVPDYDYSQNGAYFITICTQDRRCMLSEIVGDGFPVPTVCGKIAEEILITIPENYPDVSVDKYVIMPDHIHMILRIDHAADGISDLLGRRNASPTVGNVIGWYKYQTTKQINLLAGTPGEKIFQRSYYDHVIRNGRDYDEIWDYIENNPRKWITAR